MPKGKEAMSIPYEPPSAQFSPQWDGWTDKAGGRGAQQATKNQIESYVMEPVILL